MRWFIMRLYNAQSNGDVPFLLPLGQTQTVIFSLLLIDPGALEIHFSGSMLNADIPGLKTKLPWLKTEKKS